MHQRKRSTSGEISGSWMETLTLGTYPCAIYHSTGLSLCLMSQHTVTVRKHTLLIATAYIPIKDVLELGNQGLNINQNSWMYQSQHGPRALASYL